MGVPTFGGADIFGSAVTIVPDRHPNAEQRDEYGGVDGETTVFMGLRGITFAIRGVLEADDFDDLITVEAYLMSYGDSIARQLVDTTGRVFNNVYFKGEYKPSPDGIKYTDVGVCLPYTATFYALTPS